jgi:hypothetical protein
MLNPRERCVLDTLLPSGAHPTLKLGIFDAGFDEFYKDFSANGLWTMRLGFKGALFVGAWIAPLLIGRLPPITLHDRPTREAALEALGSTRFYLLRQMMLVLKAVASFCYGANRDVRDAIGFPIQFDDPRSARLK